MDDDIEPAAGLVGVGSPGDVGAGQAVGGEAGDQRKRALVAAEQGDVVGQPLRHRREGDEEVEDEGAAAAEDAEPHAARLRPAAGSVIA